CKGDAGPPRPGPVVVRMARDRQLWINGVRLSWRHRGFLGARPVILLVIVDPRASNESTAALMQRLYRFSQPEIRLVQALIAGASLREAAEAARITYETARTYLKSVFQKTETSRQGELVARILGDATAALQCMVGGPQ
ncbi:MAG: helix-turn-helix transcriptional regulator, partial [Acetobacteraceae bacterium]